MIASWTKLSIRRGDLKKWLVMTFGVFALTVSLAYASGPLMAISIDDAPITYRYATNLSEGLGFVYNPGQRIQGTSTPLFVLVLAILARLGIAPELAGPYLGLAGMVGACLLLYALVARASSPRAGFLAAILVATDGTAALWASSGMETGVYVGLIMLALWAYGAQRDFLLGVAAGLCGLMRLDGLIVAAVLLTLRMWQGRQLPWRSLLPCAVLLVPWFIFAQLYFGSWLPLSLSAKQQHSHLAGPFWMVQYFVRAPYQFYLPLLFVAVGWLVGHRRWREWLPLLMYGGAYATAFVLVGLDQYGWYTVPIIPLFFAVAGFGAVAVVDLFDGWLESKVLAYALSASFIGMMLAVNLYYGLGATRQHRWYLETVEASRVEIGQWLAENTPPDAVVAAGAIGHIGYYSGREIVDLAGLVTPGALESDLATVLEEHGVQYYVAQDIVNYPFLLEGYLAENFHVIKRWPGNGPLLKASLVLERNQR